MVKQIYSFQSGTKKVLPEQGFASEKALETVVSELRRSVGLPTRILLLIAKSEFTDEEIREIYQFHRYKSLATPARV